MGFVLGLLLGCVGAAGCLASVASIKWFVGTDAILAWFTMALLSMLLILFGLVMMLVYLVSGNKVIDKI